MAEHKYLVHRRRNSVFPDDIGVYMAKWLQGHSNGTLESSQRIEVLTPVEGFEIIVIMQLHSPSFAI